MERRYKDISELKLFTHKIDKEITMLLQSLQWNQSKLMEETMKETCRHNPNHKIPPDKRETHEQDCFLSCQGYSKEDKLLPEPLDPYASTLVKLCKDNITQIINNARKADPLFKCGPGVDTSEPCTLERLQATYSADERRAIHNAVVEAVPFCHDLTDLALPSTSGDDGTASRDKSRAEILAELRDMKRRRTKYRVAAKTRNYSDVLRDVIKTQMELYTEVKTEIEIKSELIERENDSRHASEHKYYKENLNKTIDKDSLDNSANKKNNNHRKETCIEDRQNKETSRYYPHDDRSNATYKDRCHNHDTNVHKKEFHKRDESRNKYQMKSNRDTRNDDHYRSKYKEERDRTRDERYDRKYNADNVRDRDDKYQNKASCSKDYKNSQKRDYRDDKYKEKYKAYDSRDTKEEGKFKRYYDGITARTSNEDKSKRTKYS